MAYAPETQAVVLQRMVARTLAFSTLTDVSATSQFGAVLWPVAMELAAMDSKRATDRNSFYVLNPGISEPEFDQRLREFPGGVARLPPSPASGPVLSVSRQDTANTVTLNAGTTVRSTRNGQTYRVSQATVFNIGVGTVTGIPVVCTQAGTAGNCASGDIDTPDDMPDWVLSVTNLSGLFNGRNAETVEECQIRLANALAGLSRSQPAALEYRGTTFIASDGSRLRFAKYALDYAMGAGNGLLMVDDGTGLAGSQVAGAAISGTVPANGITLLYHEKPATQPIDRITVNRAAGGTEVLYRSAGAFASFPAQGIIYIPQGTLLPGDVWTVQNYAIYRGIVAELQQDLNGEVTDGLNSPGWIAAGCNVRVVVPNIWYVELWLSVVPKAASTVSLTLLQEQVVAQTVAYIASLAPGEPLYIARLIDSVMNNANLLNIRFYEPTTPLVNKGDVYIQPNQAVRTNASLLTIMNQAV